MKEIVSMVQQVEAVEKMQQGQVEQRGKGSNKRGPGKPDR